MARMGTIAARAERLLGTSVVATTSVAGTACSDSTVVRGCLPPVIRSSYKLVSSTGRLTLGWTTWVPTARLRTR